MIRRIIAPLALTLLVAACHSRAVTEAGPPSDRRMSLSETGDTVSYFEQTQALSAIVNLEGDTVITSSEEDEVYHVARTAPDSLLAFYEYIRIRINSAGRIIPVSLDAILNQPFVLAGIDGRYRVVRQPEVTGLQTSVGDLAGQIDLLFRMPVPAQPLTPGLVWVDTVSATEAQPPATLRRVDVTRFEVVGDTVLHGVAATVVRYRSALETALTGPAAGADSTSTLLEGEATGTIVYAPARDLVLAHARSGRLDGEMVRHAGPQTVRMPHYYEFATTIDLLPPPDRAGTATTAPAAEAGSLPN